MKITAALKTPENVQQLKQLYKDNNLIYYTPVEELFNTITHLIGLIFGLAGIYFLAINSETAVEIITTVILSICFCSLYLASISYHIVQNIEKKLILRKIDYSSINLMVIACGASASLVYNSIIGYIMLSLSIVLTILVAILCIKNFKKYRLWAVASNVVVGVFMSIPTIIYAQIMPVEAKNLYIAGLVIILSGFALFGIKKRFMHAIFHTLILIGTICMYFCNILILNSI